MALTALRALRAVMAGQRSRPVGIHAVGRGVFVAIGNRQSTIGCLEPARRFDLPEYQSLPLLSVRWTTQSRFPRDPHAGSGVGANTNVWCGCGNAQTSSVSRPSLPTRDSVSMPHILFDRDQSVYFGACQHGSQLARTRHDVLRSSPHQAQHCIRGGAGVGVRAGFRSRECVFAGVA